MNEEHVAADETTVTFDVTSLFTNIPTNKEIDIIHRRQLKDKGLLVRTPLSADRNTEVQVTMVNYII